MDLPSSSGRAPEALVVLVTVPSPGEGAVLGRALVESGLAACVNVVSGLTSIFRWEGRLEETSEALLIVKTIPRCYLDLEAAIRARHPYNVAEILAIPVWQGSEACLAWLSSSVRPA